MPVSPSLSNTHFIHYFSSVLRVPLVPHKGQLPSNPGVLTLLLCLHKQPTQTQLMRLHHLHRLPSPVNPASLRKWLLLLVPLRLAPLLVTEFPICSSADPTLQRLQSQQLQFNNNLSNPPLLVTLRPRTLHVVWTRQTCRAVRIILNSLRPCVLLCSLCFVYADRSVQCQAAAAPY